MTCPYDNKVIRNEIPFYFFVTLFSTITKNTFILETTPGRFGEPLFDSSWPAFVSITLSMKFCIQHSYNLYWCFIYICNHENNVPSRLSNSCTWSCSWATIDHLPKCMSCHKAIAVITGTAHCFHDCKYITPILFLWDLSAVCQGSGDRWFYVTV